MLIVNSRGKVVAAVASLFCLAACADSPTGNPRLMISPVALTVLSGDGQTGFPNTELPNPLVVQVKDANGHGARDQIVNFRVVQGAGSVYAGASLTDKDGIAKEWWTLGPSGVQIVEVRAVDPTSGEKKLYATFSASIVTPPPPPPAPDIYEPNETQGSRDLGNLFDGQSFAIHANFHTETDVDWYRVHTMETPGSCSAGAARDFTLTLTLANVELGQAYQLSLYEGQILRGRTGLAGGIEIDFAYHYSGICGETFGKTFDVKVERLAGDPAQSHYDVGIHYAEN